MSFWNWLNSEPTEAELTSQNEIDAAQTAAIRKQLDVINKGREESAKKLEEAQKK